MNDIIKGVLVAAVVGGVLATAAVIHGHHQQQLKSQAKAFAQHQAVIEAVDTKNYQNLQAQNTSLQGQLQTSRAEASSLCGFIVQHVSVKVAPLPAECQ